jgi:uncharacterized protein YbbC (DUF1343 family)/CubicO group peptidase (beta-lactamase class C family)
MPASGRADDKMPEVSRVSRTRWAISIVLLLSSAPALAQPSTSAAPPDFSAVDDAARDAVATGDIPGVVVLVGRGDEILYHRAFGWRAVVPSTETMTTDTIFDIASLTKPVGTTIAIMSLVERGAIKLDAPLGRYVREFRSRAFKDVTIRRLLTHSAGLSALAPSADVRAGFPAAARALAQMTLDYPPGSGFEYSDTGFILLGEVVRRVSGSPLDRYLDRLLFRPLGLRDTTFRPGQALLHRIAPTEFFNGHMLRGEVHDPEARLLGGVAGHAGMFATAWDLAKICRMLVDGGALAGRRILKAQTVRTMWQRAPDGNGTRTLGWDMLSSYALVMAPFFPAGSVGHTGFTGTSIWIDPSSHVYLIVLTNRVHPNGGSAARIRELRVRMAAAVGAALFAPPLAPASTAAEAPEPLDGPPASDDAGSTSAGRVLTGLDVLEAQDFAPLRGHAVGLVTNQTGIDGTGRRNIDLIAAAPDVRLVAIFSPEHGLAGTAERDVPHGYDPTTGRPIWSLYGPTRRPDGEMLRGITALVFDVQDVGVRYYTYLSTLVYVMEAAARHAIPLFVLDRPDPIGGRVIEGPLLDSDLESFTGIHPIPVRTGLTIGEFARMAAAERHLPVALTVIPLVGWTRSTWYDETGLPWVNPSPNIRSVTQALLYSGIGLLEATNLSVGRGTDTPFEVVGAPWVDPFGLAEALDRQNLPGVRFEPVWFTPVADQYARLACGGVRLSVTDRNAIRPVTVALALALALRERHRDQWRAESVQNLLVNRATTWAFLRSEPLERLVAWAEMDRASFLNRRASYLMYR